jgi:hypothetical protein
MYIHPFPPISPHSLFVRLQLSKKLFLGIKNFGEEFSPTFLFKLRLYVSSWALQGTLCAVLGYTCDWFLRVRHKIHIFNNSACTAVSFLPKSTSGLHEHLIHIYSLFRGVLYYSAIKLHGVWRSDMV